MAAPDLDPLDLVEPARQELARRRLIDFTAYTYPKYEAGWFARALAAELERFADDCVAGRSPRLMVFAPPRHGKSELVSRRFPAWALGRHHDLQIIGCSYSDALAGRMNRDVQRIMDDEAYRRVFPTALIPSRRVRLNTRGKLRNSEMFEMLEGEGSYRSAGVGVGITGMGASVMVIDDPVKDAKEANSATVRAAIWEWYTSTAYTRLEPGGGMLLVMTRWHADDLAGRLIEAQRRGEGDEWRIVEFSAIAERDEEHRREGEALDGDRYPLDRLHAIKRTVGSYVWAALYQQKPSVKGGDVFKGEWWKWYTVLPRLHYRMIYVDTAQKKGEANDYSVMQCWGKGVDGAIYLLDQVRGKWEEPELVKQATAFWAKWAKPDKRHVTTRSMKVEDKVSGTGLIQRLKRPGDGKPRIPVLDIQRNTDKLTRAGDGAPWIESGHVYLPDPEYHDVAWLSDYLMEFEAFTRDLTHAHDDQVDPTLDAIRDMLGGSADLYAGAIS